MGARGKESTSNALAVQLDESGRVKYSAIARQGHSADKVRPLFKTKLLVLVVSKPLNLVLTNLSVCSAIVSFLKSFNFECVFVNFKCPYNFNCKQSQCNC